MIFPVSICRVKYAENFFPSPQSVHSSFIFFFVPRMQQQKASKQKFELLLFRRATKICFPNNFAIATRNRGAIEFTAFGFYFVVCQSHCKIGCTFAASAVDASDDWPPEPISAQIVAIAEMQTTQKYCCKRLSSLLVVVWSSGGNVAAGRTRIYALCHCGVKLFA